MLKTKPTLLIVDDDSANLNAYAMGFRRQPYRLLTADNGTRGLEILREEQVDVVLTDMKMPGVSGLDVVKAAAEQAVPPATIVVTAYGTIENAVEAMRLGALDYITKPVNLDELRAKVAKAMEVYALRARNDELQGLLNDRFKFEGVVGVSAAMRSVIEQSRLVAGTRASALIEGESGTGKELIARAIHFNSPRANGPFVPIHCAAIPETLLESELFGSEKGAFTGAIQRRIGHFESADGGTVFLDEVSEIPLDVQVKLLRVLEQREITRVGANRPTAIDIRLVAATNKNLETLVESGRFRQDLYYRLNVVRITLPPLRERAEDIPPLVRHFLEELCRQHQRPSLRISAEALERITAFPWPGNIRELRNAIEQMVVFATGETIEVPNLPPAIRGTPSGAGTPASQPSILNGGLNLGEVERQCILRALEQTGQNRTQAAACLGISRRTLQRRLKELGLESVDAPE
jgi:DNA-binding NtrC family response regulator